MRLIAHRVDVRRWVQMLGEASESRGFGRAAAMARAQGGRQDGQRLCPTSAERGLPQQQQTETDQKDALDGSVRACARCPREKESVPRPCCSWRFALVLSSSVELRTSDEGWAVGPARGGGGRRTFADDLAERVPSYDPELLRPELLAELLVGVGELPRGGRRQHTVRARAGPLYGRARGRTGSIDADAPKPSGCSGCWSSPAGRAWRGHTCSLERSSGRGWCVERRGPPQGQGSGGR